MSGGALAARVPRVPTGDHVLHSTPDAPWLPAGGDAHVVLAPQPGGPAPRPTCLVRLLVTRPGHVLVVPRPDGGVDIPTSPVGTGTVEERLAALVERTTGTRRAVGLLGWVHNDVPRPDAAYAWPAPSAYFTVWHCPVEDGTDAAGRWLPASEAEEQLARRHWWPLLLHLWRLPGSAGTH